MVCCGALPFCCKVCLCDSASVAVIMSLYDGPRSATMICTANSAAAMAAQQRAASVSALTVCIQQASDVAECLSSLLQAAALGGSLHDR